MIGLVVIFAIVSAVMIGKKDKSGMVFPVVSKEGRMRNHAVGDIVMSIQANKRNGYK